MSMLTPMTDRRQVTLISNVPGKYADTNKPYDFRTDLEPPMELDGEWAVGLVAVQYPYNWKSLVEDIYLFVAVESEKEDLQRGATDNFNRMLQVFKAKTPKKGAFTYREAIVPKGFYTSVEELMMKVCEVVNRAFLQSPVKPDLHCKANTPKTEWTLKSDKMIVIQSTCNKSNACDLLGFKPIEILKPAELLHGVTSTDHVLRLTLPVTSTHVSIREQRCIMVYGDFVQYQKVGNTEVPLLGIVPVKGEANSTQYWAFDYPCYLNVNKSHVSTMQIELHTDDGEYFPITEGRVTCRLEFVRRRPTI